MCTGPKPTNALSIASGHYTFIKRPTFVALTKVLTDKRPLTNALNVSFSISIKEDDCMKR
jgi:hypothetical protein